MKSSYRDKNYGLLFMALVDIHEPKLVVELGVLKGYALNHLSNGKTDKDCKFIGIDLFEDYEYNHASFEEVKEYFDERYPQVELRKQDAFEAAKDFEDESVDILHIDLSNTCDILEKAFDHWSPKVRKDGIVIFEGGSEERDNVEWMKKYNKTPIKYFKRFIGYRGYECVTLVPFPSITICRKVQ